MYDNEFVCVDENSNNIGLNVESNVWYHISIRFRGSGAPNYQGLSENKWKVFIAKEGEIPTEYGEFNMVYNNPTGMKFNTHNWYYGDFALDNFGFDWDPYYNIGDNLNEGLFLSFENETNLDWMSYSLDNQANKTILGNATIPMPEPGSHTIQVFGNETSGVMYESDVRYFTIKPISILSPENKTYTEQMNGYYPATYGFENDEDLGPPEGWSGLGTTNVKVLEGEYGHNKIVRIQESGTLNTFISTQMNGTIEMWMKFYSSDNNKEFYIKIYEADTYSEGIQFGLEDGKLQYYDGGSWNNIQSVSNNVWYHLRIEFESGSGNYKGLSADTWHLYVDGVKKSGSGYAYRGTNNGMNILELVTPILYSSGYVYIDFDAIGYSWDPNYDIGDNLNEGLLLNTEKSFTPYWMGYSLDNQANKTILGNATIPMPEPGSHSIQVFLNNSLGIMYESDLRYFSVSFSPENLISPSNCSHLFTGMFNFSWVSLEPWFGAVNYTLQISNSTDFSYIVFEQENIKELPVVSNLTRYIDFSSSLYYWRIQPTYGIFKGYWSDYFMFNLSYNENAPILTLPTDNLNIGDQFTQFNFTVLYMDPDNNYPFLINVTINGTSYAMGKVNPSDTNYTDGCLYQYLTYLAPSPHNYTYYYNCSDGKFSNTTIIYDNLKVIESNNFKPRLLNPRLNPLLGNNSILYNFSVWYFDDDNNLPLYVNITINDTTYEMVRVNQFDINSLDGIEYYYNTTLDFGFYEYQINCSDGFQINATDWIVGPVVNPFYEYGYIALINPLNYSNFFTGAINFTWFSLDAPFGSVNYTMQISNASDFSESGVLLEIENIEERPVISNLTLLIDFPTNQYYWRVRATYDVFHGNWSNIFTFNLTLNHYKPYFISGSVDPNIGDYLTEFNFTVEYFDNDNNSPSFINVSINGTSYMMDKVYPLDMNFVDGCIYHYLIYLPPSRFNYTYYFNCSDGKYSNSTIIYDDLEVIESNYFKPRLSNPSFTPNSGYKYTIFNFTVWYFDDDNNLPLYVNITVDQSNFPMAQENPQDKNAVDGIKFYYNSTIKYRNIQFQIICSDGFNTSSTNWIDCPLLNFVEKEAYAIIIGIELYPGPNNNLFYTVDDAFSMCYLLIEEYNVRYENIILLYDNYATKNNIDSAFAQIRSEIGTYDTFFFYFSGHGGTDGMFEFICPYDSLPDSPSNLYYWNDLSSQLGSLGCAEKYIVIDACNSGGMIRGDGTNKFFMTACDDDELSLEVVALQHGLFTYNYLNSLNFAPDINGDGVLSMEEQFTYIYSETVSYSANLGTVHHPQQQDGITGEDVLSPSFGSTKITTLRDKLNFSFYLYGNGMVDKIELILYAGSVESSFDLYYVTSSVTGFGYYNGTVDLKDNLVITGYKLIAEVQGDKKIVLEISQGGPVYDSDKENGSSRDSVRIYTSLLIVVAIIASSVGGLAITVYLKKKSSSKEFTMKSVDQKQDIIPRSVETKSPVEIPLNIKYCTMCGAPIKVSQKFCTQCGRSLINQD